MNPISSPVGARAKNLPQDVRFVQKSLNRSLRDIKHAHAIAEDGQFGPETAAAILDFQRSVMRMSNADGQIDPGGSTAKALLASSRQPFPPHVAAFIRMASPSARSVKIKWGIPASVLVAQAAIESGWGLHVKGNAYFGIKGKSSSGTSIEFGTHEFINGSSVAISDTFRAYTSFSEAADDYGQFLRSNPRYSACFSHTNNPSRFVDILAGAGYATDPNYAKKIKNIIRKFSLFDLDD